MVYAVAAKVLENFERALGRRLWFRGDERLRLFPHAFQAANAFYDPRIEAVLFGYFRADEDSPGRSLPGQTVFTCLSHDIIAHEVTHALVHRMRRHLLDPTNRDVFAFHEGFADLVAIFQHFSFPDILRRHVQETRSDLRSPSPLVELAQEFGHATGSGEALRSARDPDGGRDPGLYQTALEPHERGSILVAAVFDAFFAVYQKRIKDLVRIATGGTGTLPVGDLHPDLVNRVAGEAAKTAQSILTMCVRAFEYLPTVDVTFADFLRALVTADHELVQTDRLGQRQEVIEAFRARGIYPEDVASLAEDSLLWPDARDRFRSRPLPAPSGLVEWLRRTGPPDAARRAAEGEWAPQLRAYAHEHALALDLDPECPIRLEGFHPIFRVAPGGQLHVEVVVQFTQLAAAAETPAERLALGGAAHRGGTTIVASIEGTVRYVVSKPLPSPRLREARPAAYEHAQARVARQRAYVQDLDQVDPRLAWATDGYLRQRMVERMNFGAVHRALRHRAGGAR
jgi:hypothetical protein